MYVVFNSNKMESQGDVVKNLINLVSLVMIDNAEGSIHDFYLSLRRIDQVRVHETLNALKRMLPPKPVINIPWKLKK